MRISTERVGLCALGAPSEVDGAANGSSIVANGRSSRDLGRAARFSCACHHLAFLLTSPPPRHGRPTKGRQSTLENAKEAADLLPVDQKRARPAVRLASPPRPPRRIVRRRKLDSAEQDGSSRRHFEGRRTHHWPSVELGGVGTACGFALPWTTVDGRYEACTSIAVELYDAATADPLDLSYRKKLGVRGAREDIKPKVKAEPYVITYICRSESITDMACQLYTVCPPISKRLKPWTSTTRTTRRTRSQCLPADKKPVAVYCKFPGLTLTDLHCHLGSCSPPTPPASDSSLFASASRAYVSS